MNGDVTASNRRFVCWAVLISVLLAAALIAGAWQYAQMRPQLEAEAVQNAAREGEFDQLQERLEALDKQKDPQLYYDTVLACAALAYGSSEYDAALDLLSAEEDDGSEAYASFAQKAQAQSAMYTYRKAEQLYEQGEYARAARTAGQVRWYAPALELYERAQAAYEASLPAATETPAVTATPVPAEETAAALRPAGTLAAGFDHTVVLMPDGTVRAFGDNSYGQLNVESWQNVVSVAAGAYHTLGLTADGRVLACGDGSYGQTDVDTLMGVKAIAAGDYTTIVLLEGGQVLSTGYLDYGFLEEVYGAQDIWAGSYGLLVKTANGVVASHPGLGLQGSWAQAAVSRGYAVAADEEGNTYATTQLIPHWTNVARLAAGENAVLALTAEGEVLSHVFGGKTMCSFDFDQPVLAAAAGPDHYAFLTADGVLEIRFSNGENQRHELD